MFSSHAVYVKHRDQVNSCSKCDREAENNIHTKSISKIKYLISYKTWYCWGKIRALAALKLIQGCLWWTLVHVCISYA